MARRKPVNEAAATESSAMEERMVAFAEQLGRMVGTVERKTTGWLDMVALSDQLTRIRDGASDLLGHLGRGGAAGRTPPVERPDAGVEARATDTADPQVSGEAPKVRKRKSAAPRAGKRTSASGRSGDHLAAPGERPRKRAKRVKAANSSNEEIGKEDAGERHRQVRGR
jgi:hypothetical protein